MLRGVRRGFLESVAHKPTSVAVVVILLVAPLGVGTSVLQQNKRHQHPTEQAALEKSLGETAKRFLKALEQGRTSDLVETLSKKGVVVGLEPPPISLGNIRKQFQEKRGVYCLLFDTACLRREWREYWGDRPQSDLYSYRDILLLSSERKKRISVSRFSDSEFGEGWFGYVSVFLKQKSEGVRFWLGEALHFEFAYEDGEWRLIAITYP